MTDKKNQVTLTTYKDKNGESINYGDILKCTFMEDREKSDYSTKTPFCMLVKYDNKKDMIYVSGIDEFCEIADFQSKQDPDDVISSLEIFAYRSVYEANLNYLKDGE